MFRNEGNRCAGVGGNIVQRTTVVALTGRPAARRDQILYVIEAAVPKGLRCFLLGVRTLYDLAEIRSNDSLRAAAVDVRDPLPKIRTGEESCSGIELRAHLPYRSGVATDDQRLRCDQHYHPAPLRGQGRERFRIHDP